MVAEKVPVPLLVQAVPALLEALAPDTMLICPLFEQVVKPEPAVAVGAALTANTPFTLVVPFHVPPPDAEYPAYIHEHPFLL